MDDPAVLEIEQVLCDAVAQLDPAPEAPYRGPGRPVALPAACVWGAVLVCVLRGLTHQLDIWRLLKLKGLWSYPRFAVSDQTVYNALDRLVPDLEDLFVRISEVVRARFTLGAWPDLAPFARQILCLDQTKLDQVARFLPTLRSVASGSAALLPGALSCVFDVRQQQFLRLRYTADPKENEKVVAQQLVDDLPPGCLILADLGYFGYAWFDTLSRRGQFWLSRVRAGTSTRVVHTYYDADGVFDGLVRLGAYRADHVGFTVRLVRFSLGDRSFQYVTNVLRPDWLPIGAIAQLYARRWDIELAFKLVHRHLGLHLLWSAKTTVILQQVWAVLSIAQIHLALRQQIAHDAGCDPFEVSLDLLIRELPDFARLGIDPLAAFVLHGRSVGYIRPSTRLHPRVPAVSLADYCPAPPDVVLVGVARYAHRKGQEPGPETVDFTHETHPCPPLYAPLTEMLRE